MYIYVRTLHTLICNNPCSVEEYKWVSTAPKLLSFQFPHMLYDCMVPTVCNLSLLSMQNKRNWSAYSGTALCYISTLEIEQTTQQAGTWVRSTRLYFPREAHKFGIFLQGIPAYVPSTCNTVVPYSPLYCTKQGTTSQPNARCLYVVLYWAHCLKNGEGK